MPSNSSQNPTDQGDTPSPPKRNPHSRGRAYHPYGDLLLTLPFAAIGLVVALSAFAAIVAAACLLIRHIPGIPGPVAAAVVLTSLWIGWRVGCTLIDDITRLPIQMNRKHREYR